MTYNQFASFASFLGILIGCMASPTLVMTFGFIDYLKFVREFHSGPTCDRLAYSYCSFDL
jgi:hypothetical protein